MSDEPVPYGQRGAHEEARTWVQIPLPKGCVLVLTAQEYRRGLARGKAFRRRTAFTLRMAGQTNERE